MSEQRYKVSMKTPLGDKKGTLTAVIAENTLTGYLDILGHKETFEGTIDLTGNCMFNGSFTTLIKNVPFVASGKITDLSVDLQVKGGRNVFELTGVPCLEREEGGHEKDLYVDYES
ncbi:MAG: hypothetical protein ACI39Q_01515 [Wujia sp.]